MAKNIRDYFPETPQDAKRNAEACAAGMARGQAPISYDENQSLEENYTARGRRNARGAGGGPKGGPLTTDQGPPISVD